MSNDNGSPAAAAVATGPLYGTLTAFPGDGTFEYTPGIYFPGVDSFTYRASGGTNAGNLAMVTIRRPDITVSGGPVTYGDDATITVTVTFPGLGSAAGDVSLSTANATTAAPTTKTHDLNGQATFTVTQPTAAQSPHALTATYTNPFYSGSSVGTGSLVVNKATPTINWATPADITYGTALSGTQLNATATFKNNPVAGTFTYTPADGTVLNAGQNQNLHVDFAPTDSANFNGASKDVSINVTQAALTVTANDQTKTYADPNPTFTVSYTGFVNGDGAGTLGGTLAFNFAGKPPTSYGPSTVVPTDAGTYAIRPSGLTSNNYDITFKGGTYTINKAASTTVVTFEAGPYAYRATAFTATAVVTGVGGLNSPVAVVYSGDCTNVTGANGCTATGTYAGDTNHLGSSDIKSITITKASSTTTVTFESGPYTYRSSPFTATAWVTGVGGLNAPVTVVYSGDCTNVTVVNGCTATATYAGDTNHN